MTGSEDSCARGPLGAFSEPTRRWFVERFGAPTPPQEKGWPPIQRGENTLILAPTGSGKTLAAFLWEIDRILDELRNGWFDELRLVYVSPLKALNNDIERNLREPLRGIRDTAARMGQELPRPRVAVRSGDTPSHRRRAVYERPPHVLITTPESLYIMLTHPRAPELFGTVRTVIVDEIHALAGNKRGVHLALSLERLERLVSGRLQRIGLSATIRPLDEVAHFLGGNEWTEEAVSEPRLKARPVTIVEATYEKPIELRVETPEARANGAVGSRWLPVLGRVAELIRQHRTTLVFVNNRRTAERVADRLNEILASPEGDEGALLTEGVPRGMGYFAAGTGQGPRPVGVHHGSLAREQRLEAERALKEGKLKAIVGTSSLELGIDIGTIDLVVQIESPRSVAQGLQRVGRSGHLVGMTSRGRIFPLHHDDALEAAVIARGILQGDVEPTHTPKNPLDVLAQQIVAMVSVEDWDVDELFRLVRQCAAYESLSRALFEQVLAMLSGRYRSPLHRELRPRILWDRIHNRLTSLPGARLLALVNGGTIPAQGSYGAYLPDGKTKVGELDEEFVFETRVGDTFLLGSQVWRVMEIADDRLIVTEAPGSMARMPFWRGEYPWRTYETGRRVGALRRRLAESLRLLRTELGESSCRELLKRTESPRLNALFADLRENYALDESTARRVLEHVADQLDALGTVATDWQVLFEVFEDALGDLRIVVHSTFGGRVNGAWALVMASALRDHLGAEVETIASDDGILLRLPPLDERIPVDRIRHFRVDEVRERLLRELPGSAVFGARFRQNAARALLLPEMGGKKRTPFWLQRLRAKDLLEAVRDQPDFPIVLETIRDCLEDVMDLEHLLAVIRAIEDGEIATAVVHTRVPSPLARNLLWSFMNVYVYEWDEPKGRGADSALQIRRDLLQDLLSTEDLIRALQPEAVQRVTARLQGQDPAARVRSLAELELLFQRLGDLGEAEVLSRLSPGQRGWLEELEREGRIARLEIPTATGVSRRWVLAEYKPQYRKAFEGTGGEEAERARRAILQRFLSVSGPVSIEEIEARYAFPRPWLEQALEELREKGELVLGSFPGPDGTTATRYCRRELLREMHRHSLAILRGEVRSVPLPAYVQFLAEWQGLRPSDSRAGPASVAEVLSQLQALPLPAELWTQEILPLRAPEATHEGLNELVRAGEFLWVLRGDDLAFLARPQATALLTPGLSDLEGLSEEERRVLEILRERGASFRAEIAAASGLPETQVEAALRRLARRGLVTNDSFDVALELSAGESDAPEAADSAGASQSGGDWPARRKPLLTRAAYREAKRRARLRARRLFQRKAIPGRWSAVPFDQGVSPESRAEAWARTLLRRYGVVAREWLAFEPWAPEANAIWAVLRRLEAKGEIRGGYFVRGLSGGQFALPEAVGRLSRAADALSATQGAQPVVLNSLDPACVPLVAVDAQKVFGTHGITRRPGTWVVLDRGTPFLIAEDWGRRLWTHAGPGDPRLAQALRALVQRISRLRRRITVEAWNGRPVLESEGADFLRELGFLREPKQLTWVRPVV